MKDQIGNDRNKNRDSVDNRVEKDTVYRDREAGVSDRERRDNKALVGIFETEKEAINVIKRLKEAGYREGDITVIAKDKDKMDRVEDETDIDTETKGYAKKVAGGAAVGGTLGGLVAALPALGLLAIPGIGPILAAGPIAGILGGAIAGGVAGGLIGALVELGVHEEDAKDYEKLIEQGKILILVENREGLRDDAYMAYRQNNSLVGGRNW